MGYNKWNPVPWWEIKDIRCEPRSYETSIQVKHKYYGYEDRTVTKWHWEASCISTFPGVFDDCEDNYEVEQRLRKAGVIHAKNKTDSETCACVVYLSNEGSAYKFAKRLRLIFVKIQTQNCIASVGIGN